MFKKRYQKNIQIPYVDLPNAGATIDFSSQPRKPYMVNSRPIVHSSQYNMAQKPLLK